MGSILNPASEGASEQVLGGNNTKMTTFFFLKKKGEVRLQWDDFMANTLTMSVPHEQ
jgi:hypothetical protein